MVRQIDVDLACVRIDARSALGVDGVPCKPMGFVMMALLLTPGLLSSRTWSSATASNTVTNIRGGASIASIPDLDVATNPGFNSPEPEITEPDQLRTLP